MPLSDKVQAIKHIAVPTNKKHVEPINNYRGMQKHKSDILTLSTKMTSF